VLAVGLIASLAGALIKVNQLVAAFLVITSLHIDLWRRRLVDGWLYCDNPKEGQPVRELPVAVESICELG